MAQFEYKGAELSSDTEVFAIGKHSYTPPFSIVLNSLASYPPIPSAPHLSFFLYPFFRPSSFPNVSPLTVSSSLSFSPLSFDRT